LKSLWVFQGSVFPIDFISFPKDCAAFLGGGIGHLPPLERHCFSRGGEIWGTSPPLEKQCFSKGGGPWATYPPRESIAFPGKQINEIIEKSAEINENHS